MSVLNYKLGPWWADDEWRGKPSIKRKAKRREADYVRREVFEEIYPSETEFDMDSVFVVIDASVIGDVDIEEIVDGEYSLTKSEAWEKLYNIAALYDVELNQNEYSFDVPTPEKGVESRYYYIQELWRG